MPETWDWNNRRVHGLGASASVLALLVLMCGGMAVRAENRTNDVCASLVAVAGTPELGRAMEAAAAALAAAGDQGVPMVRSLSVAPHPAAPSLAAELLYRVAEKRKLCDNLASLAGELLEHEDPFTRALAEWAIAIRVQLDNGGQEIRWPRENSPEWFHRWVALEPNRLLEMDYARLAVGWGAHHRGCDLLSSVGKIIERARGAAAEVEQGGPPESKAMVERQLAQLESIRQQLADRVASHPDDIVGHRRLWIAARQAARPIVLANPAIDFDQFVFVKLHAAHSHRNITGSQYPWVHKPGGDICVKAGLQVDSPVRGVLNGRLGPGHVHGIDLWWDADRVVFGWASQPDWPPRWNTQSGDDVFRLRGEQEPTHIFEAGLDGASLRQVTDDTYWSDFEPTYCANGDVVFASDRSGRSSECGKFSADHTVINIYRVATDGRINRLSDNKDIDRYPHSLDNGLIGYTRWEYQERHFLEVHALWAVRPDGTMADAVCKQHTGVPYGLRDTRSIPGSRQLVSIATGHHTFAYGPVVLIDPRPGINVTQAIRSVTPHARPEEGPAPSATIPEGGVPDLGGLYQTPWALSERCFLVSYSDARPASGTTGGDNASGWAIYLIDAWGNKELIHRDLTYSCSFPMPCRPRPRPPQLPDNCDADPAPAVCYVGNVYHGLSDVRPGSIKFLRICQRVGWPLDDKIGAMRYIPGNAWEKQFGFWAWAPARVIGTVPVEEDGSACFRLPADTAVYFQALDEDHMEVRRMRSHISLQPGERRGCAGCHETRPQAPPQARSSVALQREPRTPEPPAWGATKLLGYEWLIQPIFDEHCVRCHGQDDPDGGLDLTASIMPDGMMRSYWSLFGRRENSKETGPALVSVSNRFSNAAITQPREFGSQKSRLIQTLKHDQLHKTETQLSRQQWIALVTWVDLNAPYYDTFFNRRPADGGAPRRDVRIDWPEPFASASQ